MSKTEKSLSAYILLYAKKLKLIEKFGGKCCVCGENRPWLLCFHHKNPISKKETLATLIKGRFSNILEESDKCDLLCFNCHGEYHHRNRNRNKKTQLTKLLMLSVVSEKHECSNCGYKKTETCLDFHHLTPQEKESKLSKIVVTKRYKTINDIELEIKKELEGCIILCSNCHQDLHFDKENFSRNYLEIIKKKENYKELRRPLPKEDIVKMYKNGYSITEIAKVYSTNKSTIGTITRKLKLGISQKDRNKRSKEWKERADILFSQGKKWCEVANILKIKKVNVYKYMLRKYGKIINKT